MSTVINKFYRKIANNGNDGDYELVGTVGVGGIELAVLRGCSASANGQQGLVPAPVSGYQNRILTGDATWKTINTLLSNSGLIKNNLTTTASGSVLDAYQGKVLNDKITSTNSTVSSLNSKLTTANNNISSNTKKINTANSNISSVTSRVSSLESKVNKLDFSNIVPLHTSEHGSTFSFTNSRTSGYSFYLLMIRVSGEYYFQIVGHGGNYKLSVTTSDGSYYTTHYQVNVIITNSGTRYTVTLKNPCGSRNSSYFGGTFIYISKVYGILA